MQFLAGILLFVVVVAVLQAPLPLQDQRGRDSEY
jgi:hypothetical protein